MKIFTTRSAIRNVAERWKESYQRTDGSWSTTRSGDSGIVYQKLCNLDAETATESDVEKIIGNDSWTTLNCDECKRQVSMVVRLGDEPDYESATASICQECLGAAVDLANKDKAGAGG